MTSRPPTARATWTRIALLALIAGALAALGLVGQRVFESADGFAALFLAITSTLSVVLALVAIIGAVRLLTTDRRSTPVK
ncbi:hypothetical protein GCM10027413_12870 [Conyzicola nivalis]|uniref:Uncharacterized protein n=1 Tax=Conyzicola nivalis TaxID=1477021 RepID=A0A916SJE3_9MICO|nr:hypothetical protein [Conyzicola nivalis]GGB00530.1 hypothetical protein GCM10010979_13760 [Conyzicola nivalis]